MVGLDLSMQYVYHAPDAYTWYGRYFISDINSMNHLYKVL